MSMNALVMKKLLPVDLVTGKNDIFNIVNNTKPTASGKYRSVWLGNYKVIKWDNLTDGRESNRQEVQSYNANTEPWLPKLHLTSPNLRVIVSERLITVEEDQLAVYQAARTKLGSMVSWFLTNHAFKDKDEAWNHGVRLFLYYTKQCLKWGYTNDYAKFNNYFNWVFKSRGIAGTASWHTMLTPEILELCNLFQEDVIADLHHNNIGISQFDGTFKLLDFGGN